MRDAGGDVNGVAIGLRQIEAELCHRQNGPAGLARRLDHRRDGAAADLELERRLVDDVPGTAAGLAGDRLDEVGLGPGDRIGSELLAVLVEDERVAAV